MELELERHAFSEEGTLGTQQRRIHAQLLKGSWVYDAQLPACPSHTVHKPQGSRANWEHALLQHLTGVVGSRIEGGPQPFPTLSTAG